MSWFIGTVLYFNTALNEYKVSFTDRTFDYICKEDIDSIEIAFLSLESLENIHMLSV